MNKLKTTQVSYISISPDFADQRIDNFLMTKLKNVPKTYIYRIIRKGEVRVNKKRIAVSYRLQANDQVRLPPMKRDLPSKPLTPHQRLVTLLKNSILFEDDHFLIINKPSGLPVHGGSRVKLGIVEILRSMYPHIPHLELAHRLDADTSGCLALCKKRSILKELHDTFRRGEIHKVYWALTKGHWKTEECRVDAPLRKNILQSGERIVKVNKEGKSSLTVFRPLKTYQDAMLVEATLHTGRTHQIRVHAQYRHHPIAGDEKYGDKVFNKKMREQGLKRLFLHAYSIKFELPSLKQVISVTAPLDEELKSYLEVIQLQYV